MQNNDNRRDDVAYGRHAVTELLKSDTGIDTLFLSESLPQKEASRFVALAKEKGAVVKKVHPMKLRSICGDDNNQGVAAIMSMVVYSEIEDILQLASDRGEDPFILIADGIEDPHNLGAIVRTAECAGMHGVVIPKRGGCPVTAAVARASAGALSHMKIARVVNIASCIRKLKDAGIFCYAADMQGDNWADTNLAGSIAIVIGSEGFGVSRIVKELCDGIISLPIRGKVGSLNASVAAGSIIYEIVRQRDKKVGSS